MGPHLQLTSLQFDSGLWAYTSEKESEGHLGYRLPIRMAILWNSLPSIVVEKNSKTGFKQRLDEHKGRK